MSDKIKFIYQTICPDCGNPLIISQPKDHSEYTPSGKCEFCGSVFIMAGYLKLDTTLSKVNV